ncbi:MAG: class I SAM-dependent methyltransferase [Candidatus Vogelbacteria bacterium]|nr:class I SAM-dependent methyltransferase [Candidatus Vogelbacteria bacterium]
MNQRLFTLDIYTCGGFTKNPLTGNPSALDVGCGSRKLPGSIGMDIVRGSHADVVHDMNIAPWPFADNAFDVVLMNHVLEHSDNVLAVLGEAHRVLVPGGRLVIQVPYFRSTDAHTDPTHRHYFTSGSFEYFLDGTHLSEYQYVPYSFKKSGFWYGWPSRTSNPIRRAAKALIHRFPNFYDQYFSLLYPVRCLSWELEAIK